jgi:hypothetical protein
VKPLAALPKAKILLREINPSYGGWLVGEIFGRSSQNVSREARPVRGDVLIYRIGAVGTRDEY